MKSQNNNLIDLRAIAQDALYEIFKLREQIFAGRIFADPRQIQLIERCHKHLESIDMLFTAFEQADYDSEATA